MKKASVQSGLNWLRNSQIDCRGCQNSEVSKRRHWQRTRRWGWSTRRISPFSERESITDGLTTCHSSMAGSRQASNTHHSPQLDDTPSGNDITSEGDLISLLHAGRPPLRTASADGPRWMPFYQKSNCHNHMNRNIEKCNSLSIIRSLRIIDKRISFVRERIFFS